MTHPIKPEDKHFNLLPPAELLQEEPEDGPFDYRFWRIALPLLAAFWLSVIAGVIVVVRGW